MSLQGGDIRTQARTEDGQVRTRGEDGRPVPEGQSCRGTSPASPRIPDVPPPGLEDSADRRVCEQGGVGAMVALPVPGRRDGSQDVWAPG